MHACRLLVLDDDPMIGLTIQLIAESAGGAATLTIEAADFFAAIDSWHPSHVCIDLNMPGMDGLQVLAELAARGCTAQVIISSGVGQRVLEAAGRSALEHGLALAGTLAKPFAPSALRALLKLPAPGAAALARAAAPASFAPDRSDLQAALDRRELALVYQPKVHCVTGQLAGLEALVRWRHPVHGMVGPDRFIPLAEGSGLIDALTLQVLQQALDWFVPWREADAARGALTLSINLSARSLARAGFVDRMAALCWASGMLPAQLVFELTETAAMEDPTLALDQLTRLRVQGFQLSIDDFGTGYSSMLQLVRLPFSEVKVDRSFVMTANHSAESRAVIRSIVGLGHSLGLYVTAEGVEDEAALQYLRDVGCDAAQGYHIARPMPAPQVEAWCREHRPGDSAQRAQVLRALGLMDSAAEPRFDRLVAMAQRAFGVPVAMINLLDEHRQWSKAAVGELPRELPLEHTVCTQLMQADGVSVIPDLSADARFAAHPLLGAGGAGPRFYAGSPLRAGGGPALGMLCVMDQANRPFGEVDRQLLRGLAEQAELELVAERGALFDAASGLLQREAFDQRAMLSLAWARRAGLPSALMLFELQPRATSAAPELDGVALDAAAAHWAPVLARSLPGTALIGRCGRRQLVALVVGIDDAEAARLARQLGAADSATGARRGWPAPRIGHAGARPGDAQDLQGLLTAADAMIEGQLTV